jgi:ArsR family transcriptional regulator
MNQTDLQECLKLLRVFADEARLNILNVIGDRKLSGVDILEKYPMHQPTLSYHLKIMCESEILNAENKWRWTYYTVNQEKLQQVIELLKQLEVTK